MTIGRNHMLTQQTKHKLPVWLLALCALSFNANAVVVDDDMDGIDDNLDNCLAVSNPGQRDSDNDNFGNACDADLNNDGNVDFLDLSELKAAFFTSGDDLAADFNEDGNVDFLDLEIQKAAFFTAPGPSGAANLLDLEVVTTRVYPSLLFDNPIALVQSPGDATRWYVGEQRGFIRVFDNVQDPQTFDTFLDIEAIAECCGEGGLLGMAFHPDYPIDPRVYVSYTRDGPGGQVRLISYVSEFTSSDGGVTLDPASEFVIITRDQPDTNHNGGNIAFGPDGYLYFGLGDGGSQNDPSGHGQNINTLLSTVMRLDVDVTQADRDAGISYYIPSDNPFATSTGCGDAGCPEVFAWGFRNPWRFSFDIDDGTLWLGDVGQNQIEEIDVVELGGNYGWRCYEGTNEFNLSGCSNDPADFEFPVVEYSHFLGFSVTGGVVYRGSNQPGLYGVYLYADYGRGRIWGVNSLSRQPIGQLIDTNLLVSTFGQDVASKEVYLFDYRGGIYRIDDATE